MRSQAWPAPSRSRPLVGWVLLGLVALIAGCGSAPAGAISPTAEDRQAAAASGSPTPAVTASRSQRPRPSATPAPTPNPTVGTEVGQRAPEFTLTTTDGASVSLADLRGRPVWINFWSTTCPSCVFEMPIMEGMYLEHHASGLEIVGIAVGTSPSDAVAFGAALGITYPLAIDASGVDASSAVDYEVFILPTHYFIDSEGIVRGFVSGDAPPEVFGEKLARILGPAE